MPEAPHGIAFAWFTAQDRVILTLPGQEPGPPEPFSALLDRVHPEDRAGFHVALQKEGALRGDLRLTDPAGCYQLIGQSLAQEAGRLVTGALVLRQPKPSALDQFIQATNASPHTIFLMDFDTGHHFWSAAFRQRYGHAPIDGPDAVSQWFDLVHPDDKERIFASHSRARAGGAEGWQEEYRLRRADGSYAVVIDRASFFRRPDGSVARSVSSLEDVTELRAREAELRRSIETLPDVAYRWDVQAGTLCFGPDLDLRYGIDPAPMAADARRRFDMLHPEDRRRLRADLDRLSHGPSLEADLHYRIITGIGQVLAVVDRIRLERDGAGRLLRATGVLIDAALQRAEEQRLRAVVEVAANVIYEADPRAGTVTYSDGMRATFGHPWLGQVPRGSHWFDQLHPEDAPRIRATLGAFFDSSERFTRLTYRFRRADGSWAHVRDRTIALRDAAGQVVRLVGGMEDVTAELINEERLRQSEKLEAIGKLTGGVAHDFNNLLTVILGNAGLIEADPGLAPDQRQIAGTISAAARRGAELISSLMAFARRQPLAPRALDSGAIIAEVGELLRRTLPAHVTLEILTPPGLWQVEADPAQLNAALLNLAVNASDAMPEGGRLLLECANARLDPAMVPDLAAGEYLRIDMSDEGMGMTPDIAAQVFDPFFTTKPLGKGSGLGLSMVWGFAKQSGGHVKIYTEEGHGTTVTLYLPRSRQEARPAAPEVKSALPLGQGQHILVVEDDPMLRRFVVAMTERLNYRVEQAADGFEALEILRNVPGIALLFTDIVMPGSINGAELAELAQREFPALRVLFTSGYSENAIIHHGRLDEGVTFLAKPYHLGELAAKLAGIFAQAR